MCLITWMLNFFQMKCFAIVCSLKAKKQGFYFFENFRKLKNKDFTFFANFRKLKNKDFIFLQIQKAKKQGFYFFANSES